MSLNRTLGVMKANIGSAIGDTSSTMGSLIQNYINDRLREVLRRLKILAVHRSDYSFTTTAGTEDYILPQDCESILSVTDKTNGLPITPIDVQQQTSNFASLLDQQGLVTNYLVLDKTVRTQPTASSTLSVVSSSASDTQTVYIKGFDSNGYEDYETLTLTGTTPVVSAKTYSRLTMIAKSAVTVGVITVTSNSGAVTNAVLSRQMLEHRIKVMRLAQVPASSLVIEVNYIQGFQELNQTYDYPVLDCAEILEAGAIADGWRHKRQFGKAADFEIIFEKRLANLVFDYETNKVQLFNVKAYSRES